MPIKIKYSACISNYTYYGWYYTDIQAIARLKILAIKRNGNLTDIGKKTTNGWSRIPFTK